ncbi:MAG: hypothetical protein IJZ30_03865 [Alphaproteobacteria bacterium]|nr:hypothetical protein [Alphaproteobacteria bacterium]
MTDKSHARIGRRVKKSKLFPLGWERVNNIDADEIAIISLPGSNTDNSKKANGFAKMIEEMLTDKKIPIYSVEYNAENRLAIADRIALLKYYNQDISNNSYQHYHKEDDGYIPNFIREIYDQTLAPRLRDENGNKAPIKLASQRLNKLVFVNHCQGSTVSFQLERLMARDMKKLGYSKSVQNHLLRQIHNVDIAPVTPIGKTKTTTFKFASLSDDRVTSVHTPQTQYVLDRKKEHDQYLSDISQTATPPNKNLKPFVMNFSLFRPTENETIFAVNNMYPLEIRKQVNFDEIEHTFDSYSDKDDDNRTKQGDQLSMTLRTVINWLVKHAQKNKDDLVELPDMFKEPTLIPLLKRAENNRYDVKSKEVAILRSRKSR